MVTTQGSETRSREAPSSDYTRYLHQSLLGTHFQQGWGVEAADTQLTWAERSVDDEVCTTLTARCSNKKKCQTNCSISLENSRWVLIVVQKRPGV
jgi:hypothetical protein